MRRTHLWISTIFVLAGMMLAGSVQAQTAHFWFAAKGDPTGTPIKILKSAPGSTFDVSIWYQTDDSWQHNAIELLVGFDRATARGTSAVALDKKIGLTGVSNISFPVVLANNMGGGYKTTGGDRPYGVHLSLGMNLGTTRTAATPVRIADISFKNLALPENQSYTLQIWTTEAGTGWTTYAPMGTDIRRDVAPTKLRINPTGVETAADIDDAKKAADNSPVSIMGAVVTGYAMDDAYNYVCFMAGDPKRINGVRVISSEWVSAGDVVDITGVTADDNGERVVRASSVTKTATGAAVPAPYYLSNKNSAGGEYGGQMAVANNATQSPAVMSVGQNNIGLLSIIYGQVSYWDYTGSFLDSYFYIDDGSGLQDGSGHLGIKCRVHPTTDWGDLPIVGDHVAVKGTMGVQKLNGVNCRYFWSQSWWYADR